MHFFDGALPIAVATVGGDVDLGSTAFTAGLYNLAAQGALRVVAAQSADVPSLPEQHRYRLEQGL